MIIYKSKVCLEIVRCKVFSPGYIILPVTNEGGAVPGDRQPNVRFLFLTLDNERKILHIYLQLTCEFQNNRGCSGASKWLNSKISIFI